VPARPQSRRRRLPAVIHVAIPSLAKHGVPSLRPGFAPPKSDD
jgi:hypothetical protein